MLTPFGTRTTSCIISPVKNIRFNSLRFAKHAFSNLNSDVTKTNTDELSTGSNFDKYYTYATPLPVKGIWRAPRELVFSKEQFEKAYPKDYYGMRIGLPPKDSWMAKYINPKYDSVSPIIWTLLIISPVLYFVVVHTLWEHGILPSNKESH